MNSIGSFTPDTREVDRHVLERAGGRIVIDDEGARRVGDFAIEGWNEMKLLGEVINGAGEGLGEISFYKGVGVGWMDVVAGGVIVDELKKGGGGNVGVVRLD